MFRMNTKHTQPALISVVSELPEKQMSTLKGSWANRFFEDNFCLIDEEGFAPMYSSEPSRPNVPVNLLVGLEVLKAGFGWSDAERRRRSQIYLQDGRNLRASVEATVCQVKHPFPGRKLPVRGQFRVTCMLIGSAIVSSIRRIQRYNLKETQKNDQMATQGQQEGNQPSSFCVFIIYLHSLITPFTCKMRVFCR